MKIPIGLEIGDVGRVVAWVFPYPGCFAYGLTTQEALDALPSAVREYACWVEKHSGESWLDSDRVELSLVETIQNYFIDEHYDLCDENGKQINAWFLYDWKPLTEQEIQRALSLLAWSRADLLEAVRDLSPQDLHKKQAGEGWDIEEVLRHVVRSERWYLDRLGMAFPREDLPQDIWEGLEKARAQMLKILPGLVGSRQVVGIDGEIWSPRKMLRRTVEHERDHTRHICQILSYPK